MQLSAAFSHGLAMLKGPIARGSIASLAIRLLGIVLLLAQAIIAARLLGPEGYGAVAVAVSMAQVASMIALFGYHSHAVPKIAADLAQNRFGAIRQYVLQAGLVVFGLSVCAALFVRALGSIVSTLAANVDGLIFGSMALIPIIAGLKLFRGINQGFAHVVHAQLPNEVIRPALLLFALAALYVAGLTISPDVYLQVLILANLCALVVIMLPILWDIKSFKSDPTTPQALPTFSTAPSHFFAASVLATVQGELGTLSLSFLSSSEQAGLFQPIARLTPILAIMNAAALMPFAPKVSRLWSLGQKGGVSSLTGKFTLSVSALTAANVVAIGLLAPFVLLLFGEEFVGLAPYIWVIGAAQVFSSLCGPAASLLTMAGFAKHVTIGHTIALALSVLAALFLVPTFGAVGATIVVAINIALWKLLLVFAVRQKLGFDPTILSAIALLTSKNRAAL